jgi:hypothetical protein
MLLRRLQKTSIPLTPEIYRGPSIPNNLLDMIEQHSLFSNTERREGIYIKVEDAEKVVERQVPILEVRLTETDLSLFSSIDRRLSEGTSSPEISIGQKVD